MGRGAKGDSTHTGLGEGLRSNTPTHTNLKARRRQANIVYKARRWDSGISHYLYQSRTKYRFSRICLHLSVAGYEFPAPS